MKSIVLGAGLVCSFIFSGSVGAEVFSLQSDNDGFTSNDDEHYTNGLELAVMFKPEENHWTRSIANMAPGLSGAELSYSAYRFSHQLYTPEDIESEGLQQEDRPYAAVLSGGITLVSVKQEDWLRNFSTLTIDAGLVGQGAGGEKIQREVHRVTNSDTPRGWANQLENEPFVNLGYEKRWWFRNNLSGLELEYGPSAGGAIGNLYTYASSGVGLRIGRGLSRSMGPSSVAPVTSGVSFFDLSQEVSWYLFTNVEGRYMAHNMLLDGNTFKSSHSVDKENLVGDVQLGVALIWHRWQVSFTNVWRSREFKSQEKHDQFGSINVSTWL